MPASPTTSRRLLALPLAALCLSLVSGCAGEVRPPGPSTPTTTASPPPPSLTPAPTPPDPSPASTPTTSTPTTSPPLPAPVAGLTASFYGLGALEVGISPETVERTLGVTFVAGGIQAEHDSCAALVESSGQVGIVVDAEQVEAYLIRTPGIPLTAFTEHPIEVGDDIDTVGIAYPQWYAGSYSTYTSRFNGPRILISPPQLTGSLRTYGFSALFEADPAGVIRQIRVGSTSYVDHVDYCTTPE